MYLFFPIYYLVVYSPIDFYPYGLMDVYFIYPLSAFFTFFPSSSGELNSDTYLSMVGLRWEFPASSSIMADHCLV